MTATFETRELKLLVAIFANIFANPTKQEYRNLNLKHITKKFNNSHTYLNWLFNAGFAKEHNDTRLILHPSKLHQLADVYNLLKIIMGQPNKHHQQLKQHNSLLLRIFKNILNDPKNEKLKKLNYKRIANKLNNSIKDLSLLFQAGFEESNDGKSLLFNSNKLNILSNVYNSLLSEINQSQMQSPSDFQLNDTSKVTNFREHKSEHCTLDECTSLYHIGAILRKYKKYIQCHQSTQDNKDINLLSIHQIYEEVGDKYDNVQLLNDYNHILLIHDNEFDEVYHTLRASVYDGSTCNASQCLLIKRNRRNRFQITTQDNISRRLYFGRNEIVPQQLFDRIHCHFFHTFDIGYRLTDEEKHKIESEFKALKNEDTVYDHFAINTHKAMKSKPQLLQHISAPKNKFVSHASAEQPKQYSYSIRFFYWDVYKDNDNTHDLVLGIKNPDAANDKYTLGQCYVPNKYQNFKQELLYNEICHISNDQWERVDKKATHHIKTNLSRTICYLHNRAWLYGIRQKQQITKDHLIAIMVQCNFDVLQAKFRETFRKKYVTETHKSLKTRHSHYHFLAKLLRECVECFGMRMTRKKGNNKFYLEVYHGINQYFQFASLNASINGPFSITTEIAVAVEFSGSNGMILTLRGSELMFNNKLHVNEQAAAFDCQWFSDFSNEKEIFCIGGSMQFKISNILESTGNSYKIYIDGLNVISKHMTSGGINIDFSLGADTIGNYLNSNNDWKRDPKNQTIVFSHDTDGFRSCLDKYFRTKQQMAWRLLCHELWRYDSTHRYANEFKSCPDYFKLLLHSHCINVKFVHLDFRNNELLRLFADSKSKWVSFEMLTLLFPKCKRVICPIPLSIHEALKGIILFIKSNDDICLQEILIPLDVKADVQIDEYKRAFSSFSWKIQVREQNNTIVQDQKYSETVELYEKVSSFMNMYSKVSQGLSRMFLTKNKCLIITKDTVDINMWDYFYGLNVDPFVNKWLNTKHRISK
eukprot:69540_1